MQTFIQKYRFYILVYFKWRTKSESEKYFRDKSWRNFL